MSQSNQRGDIDEGASIQPQNEATHASSRAAPSSSNSRAKRKSSKTWSDMWNHFTKFVNEKGEQKARCNYCDREYCADPKTNGTAALKYHRNNCKRKSENVNLKQSKLVFNSGNGSLSN